MDNYFPPIIIYQIPCHNEKPRNWREKGGLIDYYNIITIHLELRRFILKQKGELPQITFFARDLHHGGHIRPKFMAAIDSVPGAPRRLKIYLRKLTFPKKTIIF